MSQSSCDCCESPSGPPNCPTPNWIRLSRWVGDRIIPNDLMQAGLSKFRLKFTFGGATEETDWIEPLATREQVQSAISSLPNIGGLVSVTDSSGLPTGQLPEPLRVYFDSPLTQLQDVPLLEVVPWPLQLDGAPVSISAIKPHKGRTKNRLKRSVRLKPLPKAPTGQR